MADNRTARVNALLLLAAMSFVVNLVVSGSRIAIPLFAVDLAASPFAVGLILAGYAALPVFFSISAGRWVDRVGARTPLRLAAAGLALGLFVPFGFPALWALAFAATMMGIGMTVSFIAVQHTAGALGDASNRTRIFTWMTLAQSLGMLISPPLTGLLIDSLGHRTSFLALALVGVLLLALLLAAGRLLPTETHQAAPAKRRVLELLQYPTVRAALIVCSLAPVGYELFFFFVPLHGASIGLSASTIGLVFSCFSMSIIAIRLALPWLSRRAGEWTLIAIALGTAGILFFLFPLASNGATLMLLSVVLGSGMGISQPITLALMYGVSPPGRQAEVLGLRLTSTNTVQTLAPLLLGAFSASIGLGFAIWPFAILLLAGCRYAYGYNVAPGGEKITAVRAADSTH